MGIGPEAAVPSQPALPKMLVAETTRSVQRIGFVTNFKATVWTDTVDGHGKREKDGKEARNRE